MYKLSILLFLFAPVFVVAQLEWKPVEFKHIEKDSANCEKLGKFIHYKFPVIELKGRPEETEIINNSIVSVCDTTATEIEYPEGFGDEYEEEGCENVTWFEEYFESNFTISPKGKFQSIVLSHSYSWSPGNGQTTNTHLYCFNLIDSNIMVDFKTLFLEEDQPQLDSLVASYIDPELGLDKEGRSLYHFSVFDCSFESNNIVFHFSHYPFPNRRWIDKVKIPIQKVLELEWGSEVAEKLK